MRMRLLAGCAAVALLCAAEPQDAASRLEEYMRIKAEAHGFSGAVLAAKDGVVVFQCAYGTEDAARDAANTLKTRFRVGSITKQFTAMAILILEEDGKLSLADPVSRYIEGYPDRWKGVTLHHLLSHTSGITNFAAYREYALAPGESSPLARILEKFGDRPLESKPGRKFVYNNFGYILLGHVIEKVAGQSYGDFLRTRIFQPLGMEDTGYDTSNAFMPNRAIGYLAPDDGPPRPAVHVDTALLHGAGGLYSTVGDLFKWDQALYADGVLPAGRERLFIPVKENYGLGWITGTMANRKMVGHGGSVNGFHSFIARFPEERAVLIILRNQDGGLPFKEDLAAALFGERYRLPIRGETTWVDIAALESCAGEYELAPDCTLTVRRKGGRLFAQATDQPEMDLTARGDWEFACQAAEARITFLHDPGKSVDRLVLRQHGRDRTIRKVRCEW